MKEIKVSIIVPCYNAGPYLEKCLDSLFGQTLKEIEIIAINDGSTDNTLSILKRYQKKHENLVLIDQKNCGVSASRNKALKIAKGEYIGFLDSDDFVEPELYSKMYEKAKSDDFSVVSVNTKAIYPNREVIIKSNIYDYEESKQLMIDAYAVIWNKIYKRDVIEGIFFNEKLTFCEDVLFLYQIYPRIKKVGNLDMELHNYLQRPGSLTYTYNEKIYQVITCMDAIKEYYQKNDLYSTYYFELEYTYVRYLFGTLIKRLAKTKNKEGFKRGVDLAIKKVKENYPDYRKNPYLKKKTPKSLYLKYFNRCVAKMIFYVEKNKMN